MPKSQFTQADFEESVRQRWSADNLKVAIELIDWNRKINVEIEQKQKQEQKKLEQQKLKALKRKERQQRLKEEALKQEQQKASSSSAGPEQSPTKETGAIPKRKKGHNEQSLQMKDELTPQSKAKFSFRDEIDFCAYRIVNVTLKARIIYEYFKAENAPIEKFYVTREGFEYIIKLYHTLFIFENLLERNYITIASERSCKFANFRYDESPINYDLELIKKKLRERYGFVIPQNLCFSVPDVENLEEIANNLMDEYSNLGIDILKKISNVPKTPELIVEMAVAKCQKGAPQKERLKFIKSIEEIIDKAFQKEELYRQHRSKLEEIMRENGYMVKINEILEKLTPEYQALPNKKVKEASVKAIDTHIQKTEQLS